MAKSRLIVGAQVLCFVNGKSFGQVTAFRYSSETPRKAIYGIDSMDPYELVQTTTRVTGSMSIYRTLDDGGAEGAGVVGLYEELPREKYFTILLVERRSDTILFQASRCSLVTQSWDIPQKGYVMGQLAFEALEWNNEVKSQK